MSALRQAAIEVLRRWDAPLNKVHLGMEDLRAALAAPEQEPAAYSVGRSLNWHHGRGVTNAQLYAAPVEPYDQQALELCGEFGWKAIMPGEPCFVCNMKTDAQQVAVPQSSIKEVVVNADYREMWAEQGRINQGLCTQLAAQGAKQ